MSDSNLIEVEITPAKELFYGNDFGVYACTAADKNPNLTLNSYGNFAINGAMPKLVVGQTYKVILQQVHNKKYGLSYEVKSIKQEIPNTIAGQHAYLKTILPDNQFNAIIKRYPEEDIIGKIRSNSFDYNSIRGIKEKTYIKIKSKIVENFDIQEALVELSQFGVTYVIIKKLIKHYGSSAMAIHKVKENCYVLTEVDGLGFIKVDEYALKMGMNTDSPHRINAAITYTLKEEENNGHSWISVENCIKNLTNIADLDYMTIENHLNSDNLGDFYFNEERIALKRNYFYECEISEKLFELISASGNFNVPDVETRILNVEEDQGFIFTSEQRLAITEAIRHNVIVISGKAGTGKSTILKGVIKTLDGYTYETCALSGKASQRIIESTGLTSKTIHRMLEFKPPEGFLFKSGNELEVNIVVLDESSMVNNQLFYSLVSAIKKGSKFIILGDVEQLPAIGASAILKDMIDSGVIPVVELTQVHRQAMKSGILLAANRIREGEQITRKGENSNLVVGELKDLYIIPKQADQEIMDYILNVCSKSKDRLDIMEFQVIAPMKSRGLLATKNINIELQKIFNPSNTFSLSRGGYGYKVGDKVIKSGNDYENNVFNGTLGTIIHIYEEDKEAEIRFVGCENTVYYSQEDLNQIDMAYALTVHRTQGSQFKNVIFALDYSAYVLLNRQMVYTALTRASQKCVLVCNNDALRKAISKNDSANRNTFLKELLINYKNKDRNDKA